MSGHARFKKTKASLVAWLLLEFQWPTVIHKFSKFVGLSLAQVLKRRFNFFLLDVVVFFVLGATGQSLPRQGAFQQVEQHVTDCFEIVSSRLFNALVCVDWGVACSTGQILSVFEGNVFSVWILITLSQPEVNNIHGVFRLLCSADQEIIRLNVSVDNSLFVDLLNAFDHLNCNEGDRLQVEVPFAGLEQVL